MPFYTTQGNPKLSEASSQRLNKKLEEWGGGQGDAAHTRQLPSVYKDLGLTTQL